MAALLCFQRIDRLTPPARGWGFFNRHYGDFCTGADIRELIHNFDK